MNTRTATGSFTHIVVERDCEALDLFGPSVQFLVAPQPTGEAPCVIKGTIPPGVSVPIHRHPGVEASFVLSGNVEVLSDEGGEAHWIAAGPGDFIEVPSNAKHGFRVPYTATRTRAAKSFCHVPPECIRWAAPNGASSFLMTDFALACLNLAKRDG